MPAPEGNTYASGNEGGRPTKYKDEYAQQAYKLCLLGFTDAELATFFDVADSTINLWKIQHEEFSESITRGKSVADMEVANSLYSRAIGAEWEEEQAFKLKKGPNEEVVEVVTVKKAAPPDFQSAAFWLKNRQKGKWRDKQDHEHTGPNGGPIQTENTTTLTGQWTILDFTNGQPLPAIDE